MLAYVQNALAHAQEIIVSVDKYTLSPSTETMTRFNGSTAHLMRFKPRFRVKTTASIVSVIIITYSIVSVNRIYEKNNKATYE